MSLTDLNNAEREVVRECLRAAIEGSFFPDWEFHTLFGLERTEVSDVLLAWPNLDETRELVSLAINNSFANLLGYPWDCDSQEWSKFISVSEKEVIRIFEKWRGASSTNGLR